MLTLQVYALCVVVLAGIAMGALYDVARVVRPYLRRRRWAQALADLLFWGVAGLTLGAGFMLANWGDMRGYLPLGACVGVMLYLYLASPVLYRLFRGLARALYRALWIVTWPMRKLAGVVSRCGRAVWRLVWHPPGPPTPPEIPE